MMLGCSTKNDPDPIPDPVGSNNGGNSGGGTFLDADGDGVDNDTEIQDATDPDDPCSFILVSQQYSFTSEDWRNLDCDGDGVINSNEVDPDGNEINDSNGTDPLDQCSLDPDLQTVAPSSEWNDLNCDLDCFLNGTEIIIGTNPVVPNYPKLGSNLSQILIVGTTSSQLFGSSGTQYLKFRNPEFGAIEITYDYSSDNLDSVRFEESDQGLLYHVNFQYTNNVLTQIFRGGVLLEVTYDGNLITSTSTPPVTPPGLFNTQIEMDPVNSKVIRCEKYEWNSGGIYNYFVYTYHYDSQMENLLEREVERSVYNSNDGSYQIVESYTEKFTYYEIVQNPTSDAFSKIELHALLVDNSDSYFKIGGSYLEEIQPTMSSKLLIRTSTSSSFSGEYLTDSCAETDGKPRIIYESPNYRGKIFIYSD